MPSGPGFALVRGSLNRGVRSVTLTSAGRYGTRFGRRWVWQNRRFRGMEFPMVSFAVVVGILIFAFLAWCGLGGRKMDKLLSDVYRKKENDKGPP